MSYVACDGCRALTAPLFGQVLPRCLRLTVPFGEGCLMPRLAALGEQTPERTDGAGFDWDPNWRD